MAQYLSDQLDVPVAFAPVKSYPAAVIASRNDQVQLAWFGGLSSVQARLAVPDARAIAQGAEDQAFVIYFIANTDTGLVASDSFPQAAKGLSVIFGAVASISGRLMPDYHIRKETDGAPEDVFSRCGFPGDHSQTLRLVTSGAWQVSALNHAVCDQAVDDGPPRGGHRQGRLEDAALSRLQLDDPRRCRCPPGRGICRPRAATLLEMTDPDLLAAFPRTGFIAADNDDSAPIESVGRQLDLLDEVVMPHIDRAGL